MTLLVSVPLSPSRPPVALPLAPAITHLVATTLASNSPPISSLPSSPHLLSPIPGKPSCRPPSLPYHHQPRHPRAGPETPSRRPFSLPFSHSPRRLCARPETPTSLSVTSPSRSHHPPHRHALARNALSSLNPISPPIAHLVGFRARPEMPPRRLSSSPSHHPPRCLRSCFKTPSTCPSFPPLPSPVPSPSRSPRNVLTSPFFLSFPITHLVALALASHRPPVSPPNSLPITRLVALAITPNRPPVALPLSLSAHVIPSHRRRAHVLTFPRHRITVALMVSPPITFALRNSPPFSQAPHIIPSPRHRAHVARLRIAFALMVCPPITFAPMVSPPIPLVLTSRFLQKARALPMQVFGSAFDHFLDVEMRM
ncbi:unnamed protein product [Closterium sp. NIES-65]|nr:unnamed protein product [Closterium sp. NIES-65]